MSCSKVFYFFILFVILTIFIIHGLCDEHEYRLTKHLLDGYDSGVRPAKNSSQPLVVVFGLSLHHIIDIDEKNQILTTNCWVTQIWTDNQLQWNTSEFAGIRVLRVPYNRVWRPDTLLYNNADSQYSSAVINTNVIVSHTGQVVWLSHGIFRSSCNIDVEFFPFDEQRCALKWASWTYDGYQLELEYQSERGDVSNYQANGEFHLVNFTAQRNIEYYSCCPEPYPDVTYEIRLRRRPMFYVFNLILPCILINGIALLVFYVPSESGEKVTLGISALLSMTVFLMTIRETLPPTEKTPLISLYYGVSICLVSFASGLSVVTLNIHHRGIRGSKVSPLLKSLVLNKLARIMFLNFEKNNDGKYLSIHSERGESATKRTCPLHYPTESQQIRQQMNRRPDSNSSSPTSDLDNNGKMEFLRWSNIINGVQATIDKNEKRLNDQDRRNETDQEWKQIALVSDRVLLCVFFIASAISTAAILCSSPPLADDDKKSSNYH